MKIDAQEHIMQEFVGCGLSIWEASSKLAWSTEAKKKKKKSLFICIHINKYVESFLKVTNSHMLFECLMKMYYFKNLLLFCFLRQGLAV
jgi:hypothetical protein